ncbi:hypothetical protein [Evansella vedderi]|nr:hypothetical protein [Evansella vedderi]
MKLIISLALIVFFVLTSLGVILGPYSSKEHYRTKADSWSRR